MVCLTTIVLGALMPLFIKYFLGGTPETREKKEVEQITATAEPE
jgi:hypothetical protein